MDEIVKEQTFENAAPERNLFTTLAEGFFGHVLRSGESYSEKWEYVRENPVRASLVADWSEWPFRGEIFDLEFQRGTL